MVGGLEVDLQGALTQLVGAHSSDQLDDPIERDVLVVLAELGLGGRGEQR